MLRFSSLQLLDLLKKILQMLTLKHLKLSKILFMWIGGGSTATVGNSSRDISPSDCLLASVQTYLLFCARDSGKTLNTSYTSSSNYHESSLHK